MKKEFFSEQMAVGDIGEQIVDNKLIKKGWIPMVPAIDGAHLLDRIYMHKDKKQIRFIDIKVKILRNKYPDTGMPIRNFEEYVELQKNAGIEVYLLFVDYQLKSIYGGVLKELFTPTVVEHMGRLINYPMKDWRSTLSPVIYAPFANMKHIFDLTNEEVELLKNPSQKLLKRKEESSYGVKS